MAKKVKLNVDAYTIEWASTVISKITEKFSFSENTINTLLNLALEHSSNRAKDKMITVLKKQKEVPNLKELEVTIIINIIINN